MILLGNCVFVLGTLGMGSFWESLEERKLYLIFFFFKHTLEIGSKQRAESPRQEGQAAGKHEDVVQKHRIHWEGLEMAS